MNARTRHYLFGAIFFGLGVYYFTRPDLLEGFLYTLAGASFVFNTLTMEPRLAEYKKVLVIVTWVLIISTGILFLYLLQSRFL